MGTKLKIWKQGPNYPKLGKKIIELPYRVGPGPADIRVSIDDVSAPLDTMGNFLDLPYTSVELDAIHTFGIMRSLIDIYDHLSEAPIVWPWNTDKYTSPLKAIITQDGINARYIAGKHAILLENFYLGQEKIYQCHSTDTVIHETAHAILDSLKPRWHKGDTLAKGFTEAFSDLACIIWILHQKDLCDEVIIENSGDLRKPGFLTLFSVGLGFSQSPYRAVRNAINQVTFVVENHDQYHVAEVVTGFFYDLLADEYEKYRSGRYDGEVLWECGQMWTRAVFQAFIRCDEDKPGFEQLIDGFIEYWTGRKDTMQKHLKARNLL